MTISSYAIRMSMETVRTLAAAGIGGAYMGIGTSFDHPLRMFFMQNLTDATLMFSRDGVNDHFPLPPSGFVIIDITTNRNQQNTGFFIAEGDRFYVRTMGAAATTGAVWLSTFYGDQA